VLSLLIAPVSSWLKIGKLKSAAFATVKLPGQPTAEGYLSVGEIGHDLVSILGQFWQ
jgi:hypothetical protein